MTTEESRASGTPSEVLRRLRKDMPKDASIPENQGGGFEANGIEGALNQLYSYDKAAVIAWFLTVPEKEVSDAS